MCRYLWIILQVWHTQTSMGEKKKELDDIAREIWFWCIGRNLHLATAHIAGRLNTEADEMSRKTNEDLEWSLSVRALTNYISYIHS